MERARTRAGQAGHTGIVMKQKPSIVALLTDLVLAIATVSAKAPNDAKPHISPQVANVQNSLYATIEFAKKQQWVITNYVILLYGAIFALSKVKPDLTTNEKCGLTILIVVAWLCAILLLCKIQCDLGGYRKQLEAIHKEWLSSYEKETLIIKSYGNHAARRGWEFLLALLGVVTIGAALVCYFLC
jgi:hypothetical protein